MPFVAYLGAEHLHGSGVLAVLALGLYLRSYGHPAVTAQGWLLGRSVWNYVDFILTSLTFTLIGFELTTVLSHTEPGAGTVRLAVVVLLVLILSRAAWMYPAVAIARALQRRADAPVVHGWRETTVVTWAGMRGVVTVATALALPQLVDSGAAFPHRSDIVLVALFCVLVTLVVQGLTLVTPGPGARRRQRRRRRVRRRRAASPCRAGGAGGPALGRRRLDPRGGAPGRAAAVRVLRPRPAGALRRPEGSGGGGGARAARAAPRAGQ